MLMSLENSEKQELNTNKTHKISLSDEDKEFIQILRLAYPRVSRKTPSWVKRNVMDAYAKEYRYRILWRTIKLKVIEYKEALFGTGRGLEIAFASIVVLFILGGITYYQYTKPQSKPTDIIAGQETPIIKVNPNPTDTPTESIDPDIVKSTENKGNNLNQGKTMGNATSKIVKNEAKQTNRNKTDKEQFDNQITHNNSKNNDVLPIEHISKNTDRGTAIKDPSLLSMKSFYLGLDFGKTREDKELREYLDLKFKTTDLKLLSPSESFTESEYGEITKRGYLIEIHNNRTRKLLWQMSFQKTLISPKEQADKIVQQLIDDINTKKK